MRTATRIALVLTGKALVVAATATPGARAERAPTDHDQVAAMTASQSARPQSQPDRIEYAQASEMKTLATVIAHLPAAPEVANAGRSEWTASELASAIDRAKNKSVASSGCDGDTFTAQQRNASDGGRARLADGSEQTSCREESAPKTRTRQAIMGDLALSQMQAPKPAPFIIKFEAVIRIDVAGLIW
jgi:hypothetical protein